MALIHEIRRNVDSITEFQKKRGSWQYFLNLAKSVVFANRICIICSSSCVWARTDLPQCHGFKKKHRQLVSDLCRSPDWRIGPQINLIPKISPWTPMRERYKIPIERLNYIYHISSHFIVRVYLRLLDDVIFEIGT